MNSVLLGYAVFFAVTTNVEAIKIPLQLRVIRDLEDVWQKSVAAMLAECDDRLSHRGSFETQRIWDRPMMAIDENRFLSVTSKH
jgi:hypothetical protein